MSKFSIGSYEVNKARVSDFEEVISLLQGRSIISGADCGAERFELGLSGDLMIRFFRTDNGMTVNLISTTNKDEIPPLVLALGNMPKRVQISTIEQKLRGLRTLYAISYLLYTGRANELESYLIKHPNGDIENALLKEEEKLYIESISHGSWIVTLWTKTQDAYKSLVSAVGVVYERGREALLRKLEAEARLKEAEANKTEVQVEREQFELVKDKISYISDLSDKIERPEIKEQLNKRIIQSVTELVQGDIDDYDAPKRLK